MSGALSLGLLLAVAAGPLLSMVDSNVVTVAIPDIARALHTSAATAGWTLSGYLLALAVALPATTYLARRFGTVRVYLVALVGFTVTSAACAAGPSISALIVLRAAQGATAAPLIPLAMSLLYARQASQTGSLVGPLLFFLAPALGPTIGGVLLLVADWRVVFLINVPIGVVAAVMEARRRRALPADHPDPDAGLDVKGLVLLALGLGLLIYAAGEASTSGWTSLNVWGAGLVGLILAAGYGLYARRQATPAVRLDLLAHAKTAVPVLLTGLAGVVLFAMLFLIPVFLQDRAGDSALAARLVLLPQGLAMGASTWLGQRAAKRLGLRTTITIGLVTLTVSTAVFALVTPSSPAWVVTAILTGRGTAIGLVITPLLDVLLLPLPAESMADATTVFNIAQRLGGSLGIAAIGSVYTTAGFHPTIWVLTALAATGFMMIPALPGSRKAEAPTAPAGAPAP